MLSACGITGFWALEVGRLLTDGDTALPSSLSAAASPLPPLRADLKTTPEDFIVAEVDPCGQRTDAAHYAFPIPATAAPTTTAGEASSPVPSDLAAVVEDVEEDLTALASKEEEEKQPLSEWLRGVLSSLDESVVAAHCTEAGVAARAAADLPADSLSLLLGSIGAHNSSSSSSGTDIQGGVAGQWWAAVAFPLGAAFDKAQRRLLHLAVKGRYRHLRTHGTPSVSDGSIRGEDIAVVVDGHYVLTTRLFGVQVAETLADWARQRATTGAALARLSEEEREALRVVEGCGCGAPVGRATPTRVYTSFPSESDIQGNAGADAPSLSPTTLSGKDVRRAFHDMMRRFYPYVRCSVADGRVTLTYSPINHNNANGHDKESRKRGRDGAGLEVPAGQPPVGYTHCLVRKRNLDTLEMRSLLAQALGLRDTAVCFAGMKDKRAVTWQRVSVPGTDHKLLTECMLPSRDGNGDSSGGAAVVVVKRIPWPSDPTESYLEILSCTTAGSVTPGPGAAVDCTSAVAVVAAPAAAALTRPVQLGDLTGNRFVITLRNIRTDASTDTTGTTATASIAPTATVAERFRLVCATGFINYFGQQRFSETVTDLMDHTGLHLFAGHFVAAVRSIFRGCPEVYDAFPEGMDARHAPRGSRDCQAVAHALRQTYRVHFSEHLLTREDIQLESPLWRRVCERAVCEATPYHLRSLWVHAGQSLFFNVAASHAAQRLLPLLLPPSEGEGRYVPCVPAEMRALRLPMAGYRTGSGKGAASTMQQQQRPGEEEVDPALRAVVAAAEAHALAVLGLSEEAAFGQRRVAGVVVPAIWRRALAFPADASIEEVGGQGPGGAAAAAAVSFSLPSSCYATVCLREVLGTDEWW